MALDQLGRRLKTPIGYQRFEHSEQFISIKYLRFSITQHNFVTVEADGPSGGIGNFVPLTYFTLAIDAIARAQMSYMPQEGRGREAVGQHRTTANMYRQCED